MMRTEVVADATAFAPPLAPLPMPLQVLESEPRPRFDGVREAWRVLTGALRRPAE